VLDNFSNSSNALLMATRARQMLGFSPPSVAVHNDSYMLRRALIVGLQTGIF